MDFCSHSFLLLLLSLLLMCPSSFSFQNHPASFSSSWKCPDDERVALLQLKDGFSIYPRNTTVSKLDSWNNDDDCCSWSGIECDGATGHVIELDLNSSWISERIDSSLLRLVALQRLNLFDNWFDGNPIPSGLDQLTNLTHLNLALSRFVGQVPLEMSRLNKLVSLDLSMNSGMKFERPNLTTFLQNMSGSLEELSLDYMNISQPGAKWGQAISSALPNLRMLGLSNCQLSGPIDPSFLHLRFLFKLDLSGNNFSTEVPYFSSNFSSLKSLYLGNCGLYGRFPQIFFLLPSLQMLDVSYNPLLTIELQNFFKIVLFKA